MSIISASLKNFKSYQNVQIPEFHKHLNLILGSNGHGKSNLIKALLFVFSNKITYSKTEFDSISHKGVAADSIGNVEVTFEINLQGMDNQILKSEKMTVGRRWIPKQGEEFLLDNKIVDKNHFSNVIQCLGLSYSDPFNIIMQGKVTQISTMNEHDLYKLLEESTGIRRYMKKRDEGLQTLQKLDTERQGYSSLLEDIHKKMRTLQNHKKQFQNFQQEDAQRKRQLYRHYEKQNIEIESNIEKANGSLRECNKQISGIFKKKRQLQEELDSLQTNIGILTQKLQIYHSSQVYMPIMLTDTQIQKNDKSLKQLSNQKQELEKQIKKDKKSYETQKKQFEVIKDKYEALRLQKSLANSSQRVKLIQRSIKQYNTEISSLKQSIKTYQKHLQELNKFSENQTGGKKQDIESLRIKNTQNQRVFKHLQNQIQQNKIQKIKINRRRNQILIETGSAKQNFLKQFGKLSSRVNKLINFDLINQLNERGVKGVYGYIVDHLEFDSSVTFAYDIATKNKYFSILVEDQDVVKQVIEINRQLKGANINMYALSHLRRQPFEKFKYPPNDWAYPLMTKDWIRIKETNMKKPSDFQDCLQKLLNQTLGKYVLVDEYSKGLQASKTYHLNAITSKGQIVFSGGIFSKVGEMEIGKATKLLNYGKIRSYQRQIDDLEKEDKNLLRKSDELDNQHAKLLKQNKQAEQQAKKSASKFAQVESSMKADQSVIENQKRLKQSIKICENQIQKKQELKRNLQQKRNGNVKQVSSEQFSKAEQKFKKSNKTINLLMEDIFIKEQRINNLSERINKIQRKLQDNKVKDQQTKLNQEMTDLGTITNIKKQIQVTSQRINTVNVQILELEEQAAITQGDIRKYSQRLGFLQSSSDELKHKKVLIGQEIDLRDDTYDSHRINENIEINNNKIYTAKDKVLFNKYNGFKKEIDQYEDKLDYIGQAQEQMKQFIKRSDQQANESMNSTVEKFSKTFQKIMKNLEPNATCDIRLKKLNQKNQKDKFKNGLDVKVGFKSEQGDTIQRKMRQLSGGQKSIIAIAFIITLQMCSSSLFYAFDEVDAALDASYAKKISNLLFTLSKDSQYFITTFKPYIIQLAQNQALYFEVFNNDRITKVSQISVQKALELVVRKDEQEDDQDE